MKRYTKHFIEKLMKFLIEKKKKLKLPRSVQTFGDTRIQFVMDEPEGIYTHILTLNVRIYLSQKHLNIHR